jgi:hypothetical protein
MNCIRFPAFYLFAVLLPERFRGGCAFGVDLFVDLSREKL